LRELGLGALADKRARIAAGEDDAGIRIATCQFDGRSHAFGGFVEARLTARGRNEFIDRAAEHDNSIRRGSIPTRKTLFQRQDDRVANGRET
jgi:hypothetical protein